MNALVKKLKHYSTVAFPCNQFDLQEPGNNSEILDGIKYVRPGNRFVPDFKVVAKIDVNGPKEHPLYTFLKKSCPQTTDVIGNSEELRWNPIKVRDITWNFEKFLIGHDGKPKYRLHPSTHPDRLISFVQKLSKNRKTPKDAMKV